MRAEAPCAGSTCAPSSVLLTTEPLQETLISIQDEAELDPDELTGTHLTASSAFLKGIFWPWSLGFMLSIALVIAACALFPYSDIAVFEVPLSAWIFAAAGALFPECFIAFQ